MYGSKSSQLSKTLTTERSGNYHFTTQVVFEILMVGNGITKLLHQPSLESNAFLSYSARPIYPMKVRRWRIF